MKLYFPLFENYLDFQKIVDDILDRTGGKNLTPDEERFLSAVSMENWGEAQRILDSGLNKETNEVPQEEPGLSKDEIKAAYAWDNLLEVNDRIELLKRGGILDSLEYYSNSGWMELPKEIRDILFNLPNIDY